MGDDDKIYFFFSEAGKEIDFFDNTIVSRIARVCKVRPVKVRRSRAQTLSRISPQNKRKRSRSKHVSTSKRCHACADARGKCPWSFLSVFRLAVQTCFQQIWFSEPPPPSPPISPQCHLPLSFHLPHNVSCTRPSHQLAFLQQPFELCRRY